MKIGIFDSGVGGLSVAKAVQKALPKHEVVLREDREHVPYGTRKPAEILKLVTPILQTLVDDGCEVIVIACNTVSTTLIDELRQLFSTPLVAVEPMVKPAAEQTKSGVIAVCATPATLASPRYQDLKARYAKDVTILEPDCSDWALMIERSQINKNSLDIQINRILEKGADVIVLGCTHYHWIEAEIKERTDNKAIVIQPEPALIEQLKRVLERLQ